MSIVRLASLEARVERLWQAFLDLRRQVQDLAQKVWALSGYGGAGGSGALLPAELTASLAAGSTGTPSTAAGNLLIPNGSGGLTSGSAITIQSYYTTGITVSTTKFCWVQQDTGSSNYNLIVADC